MDEVDGIAETGIVSYSMVFLDRHYKTEDLLAHVPLSIIAKCI